MNFRSDSKRRDIFAKDYSLQDNAGPQDPVFVFVGGSVVFSDRLLDLVRANFDDADVVHLDDLAEIDHLDPVIRASAEMIVVDETAASELSQVYSALISFDDNVGAVLAYRTVDKARRFFVQSQKNRKARSVQFLPMSVGIESWLTSLRLLALKEAFVPAEILSMDTAVQEKQPCQREYDLRRSVPEKTHWPSELDRLTTRERQIIALIAKGNRNLAIAEELGLSVHTVKLHVHNIFGKLGVDNRTSATSLFLSYQSPS